MQQSKECWGEDAEEWNPDRWFAEDISSKLKYWMAVRWHPTPLIPKWRDTCELTRILWLSVWAWWQQVPWREPSTDRAFQGRRHPCARLLNPPGGPGEQVAVGRVYHPCSSLLASLCREKGCLRRKAEYIGHFQQSALLSCVTCQSIDYYNSIFIHVIMSRSRILCPRQSALVLRNLCGSRTPSEMLPIPVLTQP